MRTLTVLILVAALANSSSADVFNMGLGLTSLETVPVGNPGNTGELSGEGAGGFGPDRICGAVTYEYNIGKYEVTAGQYTEFLNAVAATDTYGLYAAHMWRVPLDCEFCRNGCEIQRSGSPGNYTYSVASDFANRPVNLVSWGDAARFANWLHNDQPVGSQDLTTTESGSYYLNGATTDEELLVVVREADATWVIPSEDEWYKAAYHKNNGVTGNYFDYPTSSDSTPSNHLVEPTDPGNNATFSPDLGGFTVVDAPYVSYLRTEVGAHENSESPYNTFDQGGNLHEWNEALIGSSRGLRGGMFWAKHNILLAARRHSDYPSFHDNFIGFRVSRAPEPAALSLLALGGLAVLMRGRRRCIT